LTLKLHMARQTHTEQVLGL